MESWEIEIFESKFILKYSKSTQWFSESIKFISIPFEFTKSFILQPLKPFSRIFNTFPLLQAPSLNETDWKVLSRSSISL